MLKRDAKYYTTGYKGENDTEAPFYKNCTFFDGPYGDLNDSLLESFNETAQKDERYRDLALQKQTINHVPRSVVIINASHDDLPTSYETAHVFQSVAERSGYAMAITVVNTREALLNAVEKSGRDCLVFSQCVDKKVYDVAFAKELRSKGIACVPGEVTAPGSVFSDKGNTYKLLSENHTMWDLVARYRKIEIDGKNTEEVSRAIISAVDSFSKNENITSFYVKPTEGGGGLGGFRITAFDGGYLIPDLSKVTGLAHDVHPTFIDFEYTNRDKMRELVWIYELFSSDEKLRKAYILKEIDGMQKTASQDDKITAMAQYIENSGELRHSKRKSMVLTREEACHKLAAAIDLFEKKIKRRYVPLVNEHIDFGTWGLRAHFRLSQEGPVLETIYARIFQLAFTPEGVGYVGADNISNKQTGELEIVRLRPINEVMLQAIGGKQALFDTLFHGVHSLYEHSKMLDEKERKLVPLRLQLDLAALSRKIGEGNADTARGLCLASRWPRFIANTSEWFLDGLGYYSWRMEEYPSGCA